MENFYLAKLDPTSKAVVTRKIEAADCGCYYQYSLNGNIMRFDKNAVDVPSDFFTVHPVKSEALRLLREGITEKANELQRKADSLLYLAHLVELSENKALNKESKVSKVREDVSR